MMATSRVGLGPASWFAPRPAAAALALASVAVLGAALGFQYLGGLAPCPLCVYQRYPYVAVAALAGAAALFAPWPRALLAACAVVLVGEVGLAGYHVGVEQGWFALPEGCQGAGMEATTVEELRAMLAAAPPRCNEVAWSFLGLSMAGWNALIALAMAAFAALTALPRGQGHDRRAFRRPRPVRDR